MELSFYKYQGTGNDFVVVDNRWNVLSKNDTNLIKRLCDRKFGIGADGLLLLENPEQQGQDFKMEYFNADGRQSSMCGNGGRCMVAFARFLDLIGEETSFTAIDGLHKAKVGDHDLISLQMQDVSGIESGDNFNFLDTGSPHHVVFVKDVDSIDVKSQGAAIRNSDAYAHSGGTNVNFVEVLDSGILKVRTFERGVEDETLSCGTGVTASALAGFNMGYIQSKEVEIQSPGGKLKVQFEPSGQGYKEIWLVGPAKQVFKGTIRH